MSNVIRLTALPIYYMNVGWQSRLGSLSENIQLEDIVSGEKLTSHLNCALSLCLDLLVQIY